MNNEKHSPHLVYDCKYHVVFCPKYRRKIFKNGLDEFVKEEFLRIANRREFTIESMEVMPDHVHLVISCNPRYGIMNCIRALKRESVQPMHAFDSTLVHRLPNIWTRGAYIATVGTVSLDIIKQYIEDQKGI